jgi:hypothetical protein
MTEMLTFKLHFYLAKLKTVFVDTVFPAVLHLSGMTTNAKNYVVHGG